jgi:signal recognition particle receptor subunit beta
MVDINHKERSIRVKLVYYGPAVGGKTTNLKLLHERALSPRRGQFVSVNSMQDRTILCDLLPLRSGGFRGHELKLQLVAVPGQAMYAATRRVVVKGADGVVFVANSASDRWQENLQSLQEMVANLALHRVDPLTIPLAFQYNKRDLPEVIELAVLSRALNGRRAPEFPAVATRGEGVLETFSSILAQTMQDICRRYPALQLPPGQDVESWTREAVFSMFRCLRLDAPCEEEPEQELDLRLEEALAEGLEPPGHLKVRIPTPEEAPRGGPPSTEVRSPQSLAESYAEASAELGFVVNDLREERDLAQVRLEQVRRALELATEAPGGTDVEERIRRILRVLLRAGGATGATLLLSTADTLQVLALPPLTGDPLSQTTWGAHQVEAFRQLSDPSLKEAADSVDLAEALRGGTPPFEAVAAVPLRSAERLLGLALLYYGSHSALPVRETLLHLDFLARVLAGPLEASAAREAASTAERQRIFSRASAAAVASLLTRLPPESARRQHLRLADVVGPLAAPGVRLEIASPSLAVQGDAALLRFALATLVKQCEADALERGRVPEVVLSVGEERGRARVRVAGGGRASALSTVESGPDLADAEMSVVHAIVALHGGILVAGRGDGQAPLFTMDLISA